MAEPVRELCRDLVELALESEAVIEAAFRVQDELMLHLRRWTPAERDLVAALDAYLRAHDESKTVEPGDESQRSGGVVAT